MKCESLRVDFSFTISSKWTIVQGNSATGKTTLLQCIFDLADNVDSGDLILEPLPHLGKRSVRVWENSIMDADNHTVFCADEDELETLTPVLQGILVKSPALFLLVTREDLRGLPQNELDLRSVESRTVGNKVVSTLVPVSSTTQFWGD